MDDDQEVAITQQLNLNRAADDGLELWEDDFTMSTHNLSLNENNGNNLKDHQDSNLIHKCFEFIRKHARDVDPDFILSLLQSEIDNPKRLELVMCEMLNIPNALELIREFRRSPVKAGDKRGMADSNSQGVDAKKKKKDTDSYLQQAKDMFPDADGLFLITECQQLESWEDFSRFINTVMLSGIYPKKGVIEYGEPQAVVDVINVSDVSVVETSEEEISSSGLTEPKRKRRQQKRKKRAEEQEVIDLADPSSGDTEIYEPPPLHEFQKNFNWDYLRNATEEVQEIISHGLRQLGDVNIFRKSPEFEQRPDSASPTPGPSGEGRQRNPRRSLPERFNHGSPEKSLAEVIEAKRNNRRRSLTVGSGLLGSGSRVAEQRETVGGGVREEGEGEVSTTTSQSGRTGSETDGGCEEGEVGEEWLTEQTANLIRIFPNTDPSYLREEVAKMKGSAEAVNEFVVAKLENNNMPSRAEYEKKLEMEELQNRYTKNFSIEDFLKAVPDPWAYFTQGNRNCAKYKSHSLCYLKTTFRKRYVRDILDTFSKNNSNLYLSYKDLQKDGMKTRSSQRSIFECNHNRPTTIDIQFLQEVAFIENEEKIKDYLEAAKLERQIKFDEAKRTGSLLECQCCFDSEVMVEDIFYCPSDHAFCRTCIIRSVEVEIGYGRHKFVCLANCEEKFTLACLQNVLSPELFSKVIKAIQMEEIRAAEIEDLVQCPFCNYATIMPPEEKVLTCLNPECLKESCRLCKELNHIPLRCDEVEKSEEVKMRTYIENKMTEALVRTCYKCGKKFVKEDGCNKMTCTCGAKMCYVCRKPVSDYTHFNGQGGTEYHKCPLYSTNDELHVELVKRIGEEAKARIMQENPHTKLLHDPTTMPPQRTNQRPMPGVNDGAALDVAMRAVLGTLDPEDGEPEEHRHNRDRREIRREANPYYHRHHHRHRGDPESENEEEEEEEDHYNYHRHRLNRRHDYRHRCHHNHHHAL